MKKIFLFAALLASALTASADSFGTRMYLLGDAFETGWSIDDMNLMVTDAVGRYHWVGHLKEGWFRFKVNNTSGDWKNCYGPAENGAAFESGELFYVAETDNYEAPSYHLTAAGDYRIDIDLLGQKPCVTVSDAAGQEATNVTVQHPHYLYPIGDALTYGWSLDEGRYQPLRETAFDNGIYEGMIHFDEDGGELKFLCKADWGNHYGPADNGAALTEDGAAVVLHTDGDYKFQVSDIAGDLKAVLDVNTLTLTLNDPITGITVAQTSLAAPAKKLENGEITIVSNGVRYNTAGVRK